ncbi:MAG TPA: chromate resistance protein ChrB domain-containing protein [Polyangiaceae bacterium]|nr:chromate resistance protein ChrB domain-containing protein [Polyangiaceae bacterium]
MTDSPAPGWLLLIHQIPPRPAYLRVKIGRRLARVGAVAIKNSVYVLPRGDSRLEDFNWIRREVIAGGGEAALLEAQLLDGLSDQEVEQLFRNARDAEYDLVSREARSLSKQLRGRLPAERRKQLEAQTLRLEQRLTEIGVLDFFGATGREVAAGLVQMLRSALSPGDDQAGAHPARRSEAYQGRTWVTRTGIHVDRIASAWLIRRWIDPRAAFKFVPPKGYAPEKGELRFDMFDAEFGHEGDLCTFEVLCSRFGLAEPGLSAIAEVIHDIDLKDDKFGRPETSGVAAQIIGIASLHREDEARLQQGSQLFEQLLAFYARPSSQLKEAPVAAQRRRASR